MMHENVSTMHLMWLTYKSAETDIRAMDTDLP
jgi:hypothetical protein